MPDLQTWIRRSRMDTQRNSMSCCHALSRLKRGDFSVRLPVEWTGVAGKVADTFNDVVELNERMAGELARLSRVVGKEGKDRPARSLWHGPRSAGRNRSTRSTTLMSDLVHPTSETARVIGAVAKGDLSQTMALEIDGRPLRRRVPAHRQDRQHDGGSARLVRLGSDPRGPRSGHRRQARRPGQGEGRRRHVEGPDRQRELDGRQPDRPGAQHRRRDHGRGQRRLVQEDHGRREGRVPRAEGHHQHDGGSAPLVRLGSDPRGPRSGHRRQARRPGPRRRRVRHVEGPDRQRELHGRQPDRPGAQHRRGDDGRGQRRPVEEDHGRREGRNSRAEEHHQHDGGSAQLVRRGSDARGPRSGHRRQARRPGRGEGRGRHVEGPDRQRELHGRQPDRPGAQHRRSDHGRGQRRPVEEDHGRREGRNSRAEEHHQHDGRSAQLVRRRSDPRGPRSGHRRQARRPGRREGRGRHLEGPDRQRELHGRQPDRPGAQHRRRDHGRGQRRLVEEDHGRRARAKFSSSRTPSTRWSISSARSRRK